MQLRLEGVPDESDYRPSQEDLLLPRLPRTALELSEALNDYDLVVAKKDFDHQSMDLAHAAFAAETARYDEGRLRFMGFVLTRQADMRLSMLQTVNRQLGGDNA